MGYVTVMVKDLLSVWPWPSSTATVKTMPLTKSGSRLMVSVLPETVSAARGSSAGAAGIRLGSA